MRIIRNTSRGVLNATFIPFSTSYFSLVFFLLDQTQQYTVQILERMPFYSFPKLHRNVHCTNKFNAQIKQNCEGLDSNRMQKGFFLSVIASIFRIVYPQLFFSSCNAFFFQVILLHFQQKFLGKSENLVKHKTTKHSIKHKYINNNKLNLLMVDFSRSL